MLVGVLATSLYLKAYSVVIVLGEASPPLDILPGSLDHCIEELRPSSCHCGDFSSLYRTIDGACNNKKEIIQGARNVRLRRFVGKSCCYLCLFYGVAIFE